MKINFTVISALTLLAVSCSPSLPADQVALTYVAATQEFTQAVAEAVGTGIAATMTYQPTATATHTPTRTPSPTATLPPTATSTLEPTNTLEPTITSTPEPPETSTPNAAQITTNQLYTSLRELKFLSEQIHSGLGGTGINSVACSRELKDSIVTNLDHVRALPSYGDALLISSAAGANINYNEARKVLLESTDISAYYDRCVAWLNAGKPESFDWQHNGNIRAAIDAANQAMRLAEAGINN